MVDEVERDATGMVETSQNTAAQTQAEAFRNKLDLIKKIIMKWVQKRLSGSRERPAAAEKSQVANEIKNAILQQTNNIVWVNQIPAEIRFQHEGAVEVLKTVADVVSAYHEAYKEGFFDPIPDAPTNAFHDGLMSYIDQYGVSPRNATHLQAFIRGIFEQPQYVRFSPAGAQYATPFERNLYTTIKSDPNTAEAVVRVMTQKAANGELGDITSELINAKVGGFNQLIKEQPERVEEDSWERSDKNRILRLLSSGETQDDRNALELYKSMESVDGFHKYYVNQFNQEMQNPEVLAIPNEKKRKERAAKNVTNKFQRLLLFTTHRIYEPVLGGDARKPFQQLVQDASGAFNANPNTYFTTLNNQLVRLWSGIKTKSEYDTGEVPYFQYGNERKEVYQHDESKTGEKHAYKQGKVVLQDTVSNELKEVNFKDFVQHLFTAIEAEKSLLEAGINSNHLILTGKIGQNSTFFTTFAGYAQDSLQANRIDELYKLPYSEIVEAAKIQLSSYYKMRYALNNWKKEPHILMDLFDNINEVEKNALGDMIDSYKKDNIPEWVIKRAIVHARMHLGLINAELHAISSYAHAPVSDFGKATYRDPSLKNLDTFRSWYAAEQWQVPDTHVQYMAYMPNAKHAWMYKDWNWKDVTDEGKEIVERSLQFGDMARVDRKYFNQEVAPNLLELNPMGFGGVEIQGGWRLKYPAISWINDMIDHLGTEEHLKIKDEHTLTNGWKRFENIGVNILKMYKDNYLFGQDNALLKLDESDEENRTVKGEKQLENFFKFIYRRYFSHGVGHDGFSYTYKNDEYKDVSVNYAELANEDEFWSKLVKPILIRKNVTGLTETPKDAEARNLRERAGALHGIIEQALAITTYERLPMDFVSMENPSRSQNGVTLLSELQNEFITSNARTNPSENHDEYKALNGAFSDLLFVQQQARIRSIKQMSKFVEKQSDNDIDQKNVFCENLADINTRDYSDIQLAEGVDQKGYVITVDTVRAILNEKYDLLPPGVESLPPEKVAENRAKVEQAVKVYESIQKKVVLKPAVHREEIDPQHSITDTRITMAMKKEGLDPTDHNAKEAFRAKYADRLKEKYKEYRDTVMTTRLAWSQHELLSGETALPINDTAYQFLDHTRAGQDMVSRSLTAIANTQERYKNDIMGGELNSALKKIYRKEDMESWQKIIVELRNSIKQEDGDKANDMALKVAMNVNNVMRINSDAENPFVEADYIARHLPRCAIANVVKEGPEYPWRRQDRFRNIGELLHNAQFAKRAKPENQVFTPMESRAEAMRYWMGKWGTLGEMVGSAIDKFYGKPTGLLVRERWKELSGEGLRERMVASLGDIFQYEWQGVITLILIGLLILSIKEGYEEANK